VTGQPDELVTWLRGVLDEDETALDSQHPFGCNAYPVGADDEFDLTRCDCRVKARLADIAAKRAILKMHRPEPGQHPDFCGFDLHELPCLTIRLLASAYADRSGYRREWAL
jgi:hypothetical protein